MNLKDSSIGIGATPTQLPNVAHARPAPPRDDTPRDGGGLSIGKTSGNFSPAEMEAIPNNSGAHVSIGAQAS